jgi:hypothetical protein
MGFHRLGPTNKDLSYSSLDGQPPGRARRWQGLPRRPRRPRPSRCRNTSCPHSSCLSGSAEGTSPGGKGSRLGSRQLAFSLNQTRLLFVATSEWALNFLHGHQPIQFFGKNHLLWRVTKGHLLLSFLFFRPRQIFKNLSVFGLDGT